MQANGDMSLARSTTPTHTDVVQVSQASHQHLAGATGRVDPAADPARLCMLQSLVPGPLRPFSSLVPSLACVRACLRGHGHSPRRTHQCPTYTRR